MKSKQNKKAMKFLVKAIELDRDDLTLWLRLARVAIRAARFPTATVVLEHILTEHPSHPIALPLALLVYMVTSDFEGEFTAHAGIPICLELANRALKLDPLNERAIYCVQYILGLQPSLSPLVEDILQSSPHILTESISDGTKQQSIRLVLDLLSLLPEETVPVEPDDEHATESSPGITTNPILMSVGNANEQEADVLDCPLYSVELDKSQPLSSHPLSAEISTGSGEGTATSTWGLSEPPEKRRSARVRPDVDLTDGLNRYRSRRGYATTADSRVTVKSPGRVLQTTETKPKPLNRFRCAEQVRGLLPAIVRDLAKIQNEEVLSSRNTPQVVSEAVESHVNLLSLEAPNNRHSSLWSAESVAEFLKILHDTKPNIVTFGIAIILQVSQLHGDNWSAQLCELYISMSERLRCSLPRWFLSPSEYRHLLVTDTSATETASLDKLLPVDVLSLRSPPSLVALTRFHLVYVELRLEQLECVISPSSLPVQLDHQPRAAVLLLESTLWLSKCRTEADSLIQPICGPVYQSDPIETQLNVRATSAIRLLIKFWDLFIDESPTTVPLRSVMNPANVVGDLTQVSKNPLRFHFPTYEMDDEDNVPTPSVNKIPFTSFGPSLGEACRSVCACLEWIAMSLESSLLGSTEIRQSLSPQFITTVFEHLVCIEQSIPAALLPQPLREYNEVPSVWLHRIPDELLLNLFSGRSAAPPSLAWLHWSHELLSHYGSKTDASMHCRQRKDLLFLLRQLVWRTAHAPGSDDEYVPESGDSVQLHASKRSDSASVCITPLWIQKVNKLLTKRQWCSHSGPLPSSHPVWWRLQPHESKTSIPEEIKVLDWQCIQTVFEFCHPTRIPEYDSVKTLSVSNELLNLLQAAIELIPISEKNRMLTSDQVTQMIQSNAKIVVELPEEPVGLRLATKYYLEDLRVCPRRSSTWAALGLIYYSDLEQIINLTNLKTERVSPDAVTCCLRCFSVAISLIPWSVTLLIERGCLAYQLHAYAARIVKKSPTRTFPDAHLNLCRKWRTSMLQLTRQCYQHVLAMQEINPTSDVQIVAIHESAGYVGPSATDESVHPEDGMKQAKDEEWLCRYMLAKCSEKEAVLATQGHDTVHGIASYLLPILDQYRQVLQALDAAGAKYPKKVIVYHKLPFRAVEAIEVYYRIHALALKTLLNYGQPDSDTPKLNVDQIPLVELRDFLIALQSSEFVAGCGKPRRGKKRTMTAAGLGAKNVPPKQAVISNGATTSAADIVARPERPHSVEENPEIGTDAPASPVASVDLVTKLTVGDFSSQDEFIDLTSPEPPTPDEDAPNPGDSSDPLLKNPQALWKDCVDRCRMALELVLQRLPLHYKAMYRLADVYLRAPHLRDPMKALSILLGPVNDTYKSAVGGLFKDRKQNNFFHGVWRIPTSDIDRSGNFAAHMFRSVSLTLDTLSECGDWRHLVHIFHQLRKQPPEDKRGFLGEGDRVYLARRAFNLIQPTLLIWLNQLSQPLSGNIQSLLAAVTHSGHKSDPSVALQALSSSDSSQTVSFINMETLTQIYRLHCVSYSRNCLPSISPIRVSKESSPGGGPSDGPSSLAALQISGFADVLQLAYRLCPSAWDSRGPNVDLSSILLRCVDLTSRSSTTGNNSSNRAESGRSTAALVRPQ
ncbi:Calcineurin-binding protein cabin-1 [Fasciola gigantica]|uniref:Calcineurin-binding protein cabin-1 n=1 Tax=Fasciola gigantica TaxID=46835 RepID=A0A504YM89_FASGI|nr:Calcineurin-binding protein cabin-1 [Fasciola gigantica]